MKKKSKKKNFFLGGEGVGLGGARVDVNEELRFYVKVKTRGPLVLKRSPDILSK